MGRRATTIAVVFGIACGGTDPDAGDDGSTGTDTSGAAATTVSTTNGGTTPGSSADDGSDAPADSSGDGQDTNDPDDGGSTTDTGSMPTCELAQSGPIVARSPGQVIENLHIVADGTTGIVVDGVAGVQIRNVWIEHTGAAGIEVVNGADDTVIENVAIEHTGAPAEGANPSDGLLNIACYGSARLSITGARLVRGSSGVYVVECPDAALRSIEGHDFRGPFPRGQLAQFDKSDNPVLEDFSVINPPESWPEDNVNVYQSVNAQIRRGHIDGNNSPSGVGVIFDGDLGAGVVEDVDAIRMGNGCFSDYAGSEGVVFRRTRCRENICEDQGRGVPLSNALMWSGHPEYSMLRIEDSHYFASCNGNLVWPEESFEVVELAELDFTMREPIVVDLCWE